MDFWDLTKLLLRRWYVAVPLLLMTVVAAGVTWTQVPPDYKTTVYLQLIPPTSPTTTTPAAEEIRNPWLDLGLESLNTAASVITTNSAFLEQLKAQNLSYNVVITQGYPNPIATIEVIGSTPRQATTSADLVAKRYLETVAKLQADRGVRPNSLIIVVRLDTGDNLEEVGGKVKRALLAVVAAGLLLTAAFTVAVDALARRRRRPVRPSIDEIDPAPRVTRPKADPMAVSSYGSGSWADTRGASAARTSETTYVMPAVSASPAVPSGPSNVPGPRPVGSGQVGSGPVGSGSAGPAVSVSYEMSSDQADSQDRTVDVGDKNGKPYPPDATIILPLSHVRRSGDDGGARR